MQGNYPAPRSAMFRRSCPTSTPRFRRANATVNSERRSAARLPQNKRSAPSHLDIINTVVKTDVALTSLATQNALAAVPGTPPEGTKAADAPTPISRRSARSSMTRPTRSSVASMTPTGPDHRRHQCRDHGHGGVDQRQPANCSRVDRRTCRRGGASAPARAHLYQRPQHQPRCGTRQHRQHPRHHRYHSGRPQTG